MSTITARHRLKMNVILQARPITTLHQESEDEIIHEFDTPGTLDGELYTTANIT